MNFSVYCFLPIKNDLPLICTSGRFIDACFFCIGKPRETSLDFTKRPSSRDTMGDDGKPGGSKFDRTEWYGGRKMLRLENQ